MAVNVDLAALTTDLDHKERQVMQQFGDFISFESHNVSIGGHFCIQIHGLMEFKWQSLPDELFPFICFFAVIGGVSLFGSENLDREFLAQKGAPHRDFYNNRKVDTHVHHSACMNQKHLLHFIKSKLRKESDEVVIFRDGKYLTLNEVFESLDLTGGTVEAI
ncbi:hypothetical protein K2173_013545 [Erythroxylum novogranatense]|uniref:Uncharacterized protein n=1 Tax=Erythroxylum novogranatense TaxID=1862640 RepID=A0AAV8TMK0_9ROSI|nr:hypothetical protein K2173_013545 [Erythroxylum novogranatense]